MMKKEQEQKNFSLDYMEIKEYLRNRYPLLMIDYAENVCPGQSAKAVKNLTHDEWFFQCHFPKNPLVPGILQLEAIFQTAALAVHTLPGNKEKTSYIARVTDVAFFSHIRPGQILHIETFMESWKRGIGKGNGVIYVNDKVVCKAGYTLVIEDDIIRKHE